MIISRQKFDYQGRVLIEKVTILPPFRHEVLFQEEGCFLFVSGSDAHFHTDSQTISIRSKEAVLLKCGRYFVDWLEQNTQNHEVDVLAFHLYPDVLKKLYAHELPKTIKNSIARKGMNPIVPDDTLSKFIESLVFYFENRALVNDDLLELKIKELMLLLIQSKNAISVVQLLEELFTPRIASLREVVAAHLYSDLNLSELAQLANLSLSSFKREFRKTFSDSPNHYLLTMKLQKAAELLKVTVKSVGEIAFETGFNDPAYFSRCFKQNFDASPSEYRNSKAAS